MSLRAWLSRVWNGPPAPPAPAVVRKPITVRQMARDEPEQRSFRELYAPAPTPPGVPASAKMAMDWTGVNDGYAYGAGGIGLCCDGAQWPGFAYLAELTQRPEYRLCAEVWAKEMTREWIELVHEGDDPDEDKLAELNAELVKFDVRAIMRTAKEHDGFFGAGQIYVDTGDTDRSDVLAAPMILDPKTFKKGSLKALHVVEPFWTYPNGYESLNPLVRGYYEPVTWFVQGNIVHRSRLLRIVSREMPDILKPAYAFAGLSLSQAVRPYIDNWLRTRQSVSDLTHSFSVMVLKTTLGSQLGAPEQDNLNTRVDWASQTADNKGWWIIDKETEEIENIAVPIAGLDKLQAQALEQICAISQIPKVKLLGLDPGGLNASSEGEIRVFYDNVKAQQEHDFAPILKNILDILQMNLWGKIDPAISFRFISLWQLDEAAQAAVRKTDADTDAVYIEAGVISNEEARDKLRNDKKSGYDGLEGPAPEPPEMQEPDDSGDPAKGAEPRGAERDGV
jgi:phage-related protein (TIGR01555 family)